jgi:hypothetical protein
MVLKNSAGCGSGPNYLNLGTEQVREPVVLEQSKGLFFRPCVFLCVLSQLRWVLLMREGRAL